MSTRNGILSISESQSVINETCIVLESLTALTRRLGQHYHITHPTYQAAAEALSQTYQLENLLKREIEVLHKVIAANREEPQ